MNKKGLRVGFGLSFIRETLFRSFWSRNAFSHEKGNQFLKRGFKLFKAISMADAFRESALAFSHTEQTHEIRIHFNNSKCFREN